MTGIDAPRKVRLAALLVALMAPAGLLLAIDGLLADHWWGTPRARQLLALMAQLQADRGIEQPAMLRRGGGATTLVVLGVAGLAVGALAWGILRGRRWARSWALAGSGIVMMAGLFAIGADASQPRNLADYLDLLRHNGLADQIPRVEALVYPGWYPWAEDLTQGLQVLLAGAAVVALLAAVISHGHYFVTRAADETPDDDWDDAFNRIRQQSRRLADPE